MMASPEAAVPDKAKARERLREILLNIPERTWYHVPTNEITMDPHSIYSAVSSPFSSPAVKMQLRKLLVDTGILRKLRIEKDVYAFSLEEFEHFQFQCKVTMAAFEHTLLRGKKKLHFLIIRGKPRPGEEHPAKLFPHLLKKGNPDDH